MTEEQRGDLGIVIQGEERQGKREGENEEARGNKRMRQEEKKGVKRSDNEAEVEGGEDKKEETGL